MKLASHRQVGCLLRLSANEIGLPQDSLGDCSGYKPKNGSPTGRLGTALLLLNKKARQGVAGIKGLGSLQPTDI